MSRIPLACLLALVACRSGSDGNDEPSTGGSIGGSTAPSSTGSMSVGPTDDTGSETLGSTADGTDTGEVPETTDTVMDHGVTWTFAEPVLAHEQIRIVAADRR